MRSVLTLGSFLLLLGLNAPLLAQNWTLKAGPAWEVQGDVTEGKDVSGAAMISAKIGFLVSDETRTAQRFTLDLEQRTMTMGAETFLLPGEGNECDLEAVTAAENGTYWYATGSHGVSRKDGKIKPERMHVFRVQTDTGAIGTASLQPVIQADETLRSSLGGSLSDHGLDIEGMAERGGVLFFGTRSPSVGGKTYVIEVAAEGLFQDPSNVPHKLHMLALGERTGIRDLVRVKDGFLLIAGPESDDGGVFRLWHWAPESGALVNLGPLDATGAKAEGLMVLEESARSIRLLVLFDGLKKGGPSELILERVAGANP